MLETAVQIQIIVKSDQFLFYFHTLVLYFAELLGILKILILIVSMHKRIIKPIKNSNVKHVSIVNRILLK